MVIALSSSVRPARRAGRLIAGAALVVACAGCVSVLVEPVDEMADLPPVVIPTPIPTPSPVVVTDIVIMDLKEDPVPDQSLMRLTGTIVNRSKQDAIRL